jgi:hypothetical protein
MRSTGFSAPYFLFGVGVGIGIGIERDEIGSWFEERGE